MGRPATWKLKNSGVYISLFDVAVDIYRRSDSAYDIAAGRSSGYPVIHPEYLVFSFLETPGYP
jgi:hypothetical protein